jgi:hypothetical protein
MQESSKHRALLFAEPGENVVLGGAQPFVEAGEPLAAPWSGHDPTSAAVGGVGLAFYDLCRLEVVEEVGHDGPIDPEMLCQFQLTGDRTAAGGGEDLVAPWSTGQIGQDGLDRFEVRPEHHSE